MVPYELFPVVVQDPVSDNRKRPITGAWELNPKMSESVQSQFMWQRKLFEIQTPVADVHCHWNWTVFGDRRVGLRFPSSVSVSLHFTTTHIGELSHVKSVDSRLSVSLSFSAWIHNLHYQRPQSINLIFNRNNFIVDKKCMIRTSIQI